MNHIEIQADPDDIQKALQLYFDERPHLFIGDNSLYHHDILEDLLTREGIPFERQRLQGPNFGPAAIGGRYRLVGAGYATIFPNRIILSGHSGSYGIKPDEKHLVDLRPLVPGWIIEVKREEPIAPAAPRPIIINRPTDPLDDIPF